MTRRKRSARFVEIAEAAGVSTSTVNRVLNERGSVSAATRNKVVAAAKQLGVPRLLPDPRHGLTRLDVILAASPTPYFARLELALQRAAQMIDRRIVIHRHRVDAQDEARLVQAIGGLAVTPGGSRRDARMAGADTSAGPRRDGLMVALHDSPAVRVALRRQIERGVPVVTLMSAIGTPDDPVPGLHYAGIDNLAAGRTAGRCLGQQMGDDRPGDVLLLTHDLSYRAHVERLAGCTAVLAERWPHLRCIEPVPCHDDADRCHLAVREALRRAAHTGRPLRGIYHSGAGASGIASALHRYGGDTHRPWVGHELSDEHRQWLQAGLMDWAIDQNPDGQIVSGLHHLLHRCGHVEQPAPAEPNEFRLFCAENLPRAPGYLEAPLTHATELSGLKPLLHGA
jgi:LacI family transcriptional regulator